MLFVQHAANKYRSRHDYWGYWGEIIMLELKQITKEYPAGGGVVRALKGVSLRFRKSEFVSILGPSGCGKTTMLNIIGGLDQYTDGDLVINGKSTKDFSDRDWDAYRNHSVGFVFQSYNLIPHQTVLQNVELALTLSGVSKSERRRRAKEALEQVGLGDQLHKKPNEMSGGQMQRVAIARALVNDPDIILADEPTGALDTVTSVQVMDILKKISKDKLIIMVTHNPDLAERYSSRIIRILDGQVIDDSNPVTDAEYEAERENAKLRAEREAKKKKPSMSLFTAFSLSLKNLMTKKGRTMLTSFAGSIGIIGIALILALSQGFTAYIDSVQEDALSSYPLTIQSSVTDMSSLLEIVLGAHKREPEHEKDAVYSNPITYELINTLANMETTKNDLKSFKAYLDAEMADPEGQSGLYHAVSGIQYSYNLDLMTYTKEPDGTIIRSDMEELLNSLMGEVMGVDMTAMMGGTGSTSMGSSLMSMNSTMNLWQELLPGENGKLYSDLLDKQYEVVYGSWPNSHDEIVLVLDKNNELSDLVLYSLGLVPRDEMASIMKAAMNKEEVEAQLKRWTYEEVVNKEFRVVLNSNRYSYDPESGTVIDLTATEAGLQYLYDNAIQLKISGIIRPREDAEVAMLKGSIGYTSALTRYVIEESNSNAIVQAQLADPTVDIFTGLPFKSDETELSMEEKAAAFREYAQSLNVSDKAELYANIMSVPSEDYVQSTIDQYLQGMTRDEMAGLMIQAYTEQTGMDASKVEEYIRSLDDETLKGYFAEAMGEKIREQYAAGIRAQLAAMTSEQLAAALDASLPTYTVEQAAAYYDEWMPAQYSDATLEDNLAKLGYVDLDTPAAIHLYAATFSDKDIITDAIAAYNASVGETQQITYTDLFGLLMSSITTIINAITYVLIAFVSISLIVSSIMIGVITLISVQERTKEIGILRAIGASKRDVASVFNAETMIIGFTAGLLGVLVTVLLCIPINMIIQAVTGIGDLSAFLPLPAALILIGISVLLTLISGIIPSRSAARKDPVVALRSE